MSTSYCNFLFLANLRAVFVLKLIIMSKNFNTYCFISRVGTNVLLTTQWTETCLSTFITFHCKSSKRVISLSTSRYPLMWILSKTSYYDVPAKITPRLMMLDTKKFVDKIAKFTLLLLLITIKKVKTQQLNCKSMIRHATICFVLYKV